MTIFGSAGVLMSLLATPSVFAEEEEAAAEAPAEENKVDDALKAEIAYVEALVECGFPDFAESVIAATKKKWPESDALFFAIEIRGMLLLSKFDEAEAKIAALPDRNGSKYWAARLEVANYFFARGKKTECSKIYDEFFAKFSNPKALPKELKEFYKNASYSWGQILVGDKKFDAATKVYEGLLSLIDRKRGTEDDANTWCNVACETAEMYLHLATDLPTPGQRKGYLESAKKLVDQLLWEQGRPVYFGRAIAMKANIELLKGDVKHAQETIDDYMDQLADLHKTIAEFDPEGRLGLLRQSPMPLCRYMLADMLWKEAQAEAKKPKRDDERIKSLMFGEKGKNGKRNNAGAYNHALNVFIKYPESTWAPQAGELSDAIENFAISTYAAKIQKKIKPEDLERVIQMQFKTAQEKLGEGDYEGSIKDYQAALSRYPERKESVRAIENIITAYQQLMMRSKEEDKIASWRLDADAVEGYLSERFAAVKDRRIMTDAGDAVLRVAALEKQRGEMARADKLYKAFLLNFRRHVNAATTAAAMAGEAQREEKYAEAISLWDVVDKYYTNSAFHATALANLSVCHEKTGNRPAAIAVMKRYCDIEKTPLKKTQAQMQLAMLYKNDGFDILAGADTNETEEAVNAQLKLGSAQIIRGIKQFQDFAAAADKALANPAVTAGDKKQYGALKEGALFLVGDSWGRLTRPADKLEGFRKKAAESLETYVKAYPQGKYAKGAYVKLGTIYTALGDVENSKSALDRLQQQFPESDEAKNALPRLAKSLIEMGLKEEGTKRYAEMLKQNGKYTAGQFVNAGEALIEARSWDLANQAFDMAKTLAATNQMTTIARANIGLAKALYKQKSLAEAREALEAFFSNKKMAMVPIAADAHKLMADVASELGSKQRDDKVRQKDFSTAIKSVKALRGFYKRQNRPQHEQDAVDLMSADVTIRKMKAEESMGLEEAAMASCERACSTLQGFLQSHKPSEEHPMEKMTAGELANLERCYATLVPLLVKLGDRQLDYVLKFGGEYLKFFPNGKARTDVNNAINQATAKGAKMPVEAAEAEKPAEAAEPAESEESAEAEEPAEAAEPAAEKAEEAPAAEAAAEEKSEESAAEEEPAAEAKESEGETANE